MLLTKQPLHITCNTLEDGKTVTEAATNRLLIKNHLLRLHSWSKFTCVFTSTVCYNGMAIDGLPVGDIRVRTLRVLPVGSLHRQPPGSSCNLQRDRNGQGRGFKFPAKGYCEKLWCDNKLQSFSSQLMALPAANWPITFQIISEKPRWPFDPHYNIARQGIAQGMGEHEENTKQKNKPEGHQVLSILFWTTVLWLPLLPFYIFSPAGLIQGTVYSLGKHTLQHTTCGGSDCPFRNSQLQFFISENLCQEHSDGNGWKRSPGTLQFY